MKSEYEIINAYIPESVKTLIQNNQMHKVASTVTGLEEFTLDKIAGYIGGRIAARQLRWRPVAEGLVALHNLRG